jgi:selenocysteine lyase/cysteine desulfurase
MTAVRDYERELGAHLLENLPANATLYGPPTMDGRVPTFLLGDDGADAGAAAERLADEGFGLWSGGSWYCVSLAERLPPQSLRVGLAHYNTRDEVDRLLAALGRL